jgi:hypothetical protein
LPHWGIETNMSDDLITPKLNKREKLKAFYHNLSPQERQGIIGGLLALFGVVLILSSTLLGWAFQHLWYAKDNSTLRQQVNDLKDNLRDVTADRNTQLARLAPFLAAGDRFFTNNPSNERLSLLLETVTTAFQRSPSFKFLVNDFPLTNECCITIPTTNTSQTLEFMVLNTGTIVADGLIVDFITPRDLNVVSSPPWNTSMELAKYTPSKIIRGPCAGYRLDTSVLMPINTARTLPVLTIQSTNLSPALDGFHLEATARNSKTFTMSFWIRFTNTVGEPHLGW